MNITILDRIISVLAYFTFGFFSIIWIVFAHLTKKRMSHFLRFNLYQAIFLSVLLMVFTMMYNIAINFLSVIPVIGKIALWVNMFLNNTPLYFTFTVSGLLVTLLISYLSLMALIGKKSYLPVVSDIVNTNFGV